MSCPSAPTNHPDDVRFTLEKMEFLPGMNLGGGGTVTASVGRVRFPRSPSMARRTDPDPAPITHRLVDAREVVPHPRHRCRVRGSARGRTNGSIARKETAREKRCGTCPEGTGTIRGYPLRLANIRQLLAPPRGTPTSLPNGTFAEELLHPKVDQASQKACRSSYRTLPTQPGPDPPRDRRSSDLMASALLNQSSCGKKHTMCS